MDLEGEEVDKQKNKQKTRNNERLDVVFVVFVVADDSTLSKSRERKRESNQGRESK